MQEKSEFDAQGIDRSAYSVVSRGSRGEYGYPRGGRRRSILAALDDRAALRDRQSSLRISPPVHPHNAVGSPHMDGLPAHGRSAAHGRSPA